VIYSAGVGRVFPGYRKFQYERVLKALAHADTGTNYAREHLRYLPARLLPPRGQLIYISPLAANDLEPIMRYQDLGYSVLIISPNPLFFEQQLEPDPTQPDFQLAKRFAQIERDLLLSNLQQNGVQVANWNVDQPLSQVIDKVRSHNSPLHRTLQVLQ